MNDQPPSDVYPVQAAYRYLRSVMTLRPDHPYQTQVRSAGGSVRWPSGPAAHTYASLRRPNREPPRRWEWPNIESVTSATVYIRLFRMRRQTEVEPADGAARRPPGLKTGGHQAPGPLLARCHPSPQGQPHWPYAPVCCPLYSLRPRRRLRMQDPAGRAGGGGRPGWCPRARAWTWWGSSMATTAP